MTSRNDSSKSPGKPVSEGAGPKKPSALLDLKATEVSSSETRPALPASSGRPDSQSAATPSSGSKAQERGSGMSPAPAASASKSSASSGPSASAAPKAAEPRSSAGAANLDA